MNLIENLFNSEPQIKSDQRVYTTSFFGKQVTDLPGLLKALEAILIDVRFAPESKPIEWSKEYLRLLLRKKYLHIPSLGNREKKDSQKISIQNLSLGIKIITELKINVLLICECERE